MAMTRLPAWAYAAIAVIPALIVLGYSSQLDPVSRVELSIPAVLWTLAFGVVGWKRLDESGREAHKFAWFYGGGFALMAALVSTSVVHFLPAAGNLVDGVTASWAQNWPEGQAGFALGVMFAAMAQVIGYAIVWSGWWLARRR